MSDEGMAALREIRDLVVRVTAEIRVRDEELAALYDRVADLEAKCGRHSVRIGKNDARFRAASYEISALSNRVLRLENR